MAKKNSFPFEKKLSLIGTMIMIDALIEMGYYVLPNSKKLDRELHVDIAAFKVIPDNKKRWKRGSPIPTGIDVKYVKRGPALTGKMFFEVENKEYEDEDEGEEKETKKEGWGRYAQEHFMHDIGAFDEWIKGNDVVLNIAFVQQDEIIKNPATEEKIKNMKTVDEIVAYYQQEKAEMEKHPIIMAPLVYMQCFDEANRDMQRKNNYCSKLTKAGNGLLMPLAEYAKNFAYFEIRWNEEEQKWNIKKYGKAIIPKNKPASEPLPDEAKKEDLQILYDDQLQKMQEGTLNYKYLLDVEHWNNRLKQAIEELMERIGKLCKKNGWKKTV